MQKRILETIRERKNEKLKSFILLIDPDKFDETVCQKLDEINAFSVVDLVLVGGSLINSPNFSESIRQIKQITSKPVVIFPGSSMHIDLAADGILFLSLISGKNPEFLIGQHIIAAPLLKRSKLEILPTGYMLVDGGKQTTASYISNTNPLPHDKPEVAACIAMAGEMLGLQMIYADAGSGAEKPISNKMIHLIRKSIDVPLIIGGGIRSVSKATEVLEAGADMIVVGNAAEDQPELILQIGEQVQKMNKMQ